MDALLEVLRNVLIGTCWTQSLRIWAGRSPLRYANNLLFAFYQGHQVQTPFFKAAIQTCDIQLAVKQPGAGNCLKNKTKPSNIVCGDLRKSIFLLVSSKAEVRQTSHCSFKKMKITISIKRYKQGCWEMSWKPCTEYLYITRLCFLSAVGSTLIVFACTLANRYTYWYDKHGI